MNLLGEEGVAAITIINYAQFLMNTFYIGFSMGVAPVIGFNYGEGNHIKQKRILRICVRFVVISSAVVFVAAFAGSGLLVGLYTGNGGAVYDLAVDGFRLFAINFLFSGLNIFTSAMFTALSNGKVSALLSFLRTFVFLVTAILVLPYMFDITGIWLAIPTAELAAVVFSVTFFVKQYRKL